jgi:hypothetical protein
MARGVDSAAYVVSIMRKVFLSFSVVFVVTMLGSACVGGLILGIGLLLDLGAYVTGILGGLGVAAFLYILDSSSFLTFILDALSPTSLTRDDLFLGNQASLPQDNSKSILRRLVRLVLEEDEGSIWGDLQEEFSEFQSKKEAYIWLCKQILKSAPILIYKAIKRRFASYFGERTH